MIRLARISVYPVKSLSPIVVDAARVLPSGALENDRRFALCDASGAFINGKREPRVHLLRSRYDVAARMLHVAAGDAGEWREFQLDIDRLALEAWLSEFFETGVALRENAEGGFPDDGDAPGPTIISTATLQTVASWFEGMTLEEVRLRFRANLEIDAVEPFWEDRLFGRPGAVVRFAVGAARFEGTNPCARCVVPSRASDTGVADRPHFQKQFARLRESTLPPWAESSRFDHFYRLAVNTRPAADSHVPAAVRVGDTVKIG